MLDHKHLISKGALSKILTIEDVTVLIDTLVDILDMKYVATMPANPVVGYEPNENPGVTGVGIITTSHIVLHTWDETMLYQLDVYSCKDFHPSQVNEVLKLYGMQESDRKFFDRNYNIQEINI